MFRGKKSASSLGTAAPGSPSASPSRGPAGPATSRPSRVPAPPCAELLVLQPGDTPIDEQRCEAAHLGDQVGILRASTDALCRHQSEVSWERCTDAHVSNEARVAKQRALLDREKDVQAELNQQADRACRTKLEALEARIDELLEQRNQLRADFAEEQKRFAEICTSSEDEVQRLCLNQAQAVVAIVMSADTELREMCKQDSACVAESARDLQIHVEDCHRAHEAGKAKHIEAMQRIRAEGEASVQLIENRWKQDVRDIQAEQKAAHAAADEVIGKLVCDRNDADTKARAAVAAVAAAGEQDKSRLVEEHDARLQRIAVDRESSLARIRHDMEALSTDSKALKTQYVATMQVRQADLDQGRAIAEANVQELLQRIGSLREDEMRMRRAIQQQQLAAVQGGEVAAA